MSEEIKNALEQIKKGHLPPLPPDPNKKGNDDTPLGIEKSTFGLEAIFELKTKVDNKPKK